MTHHDNEDDQEAQDQLVKTAEHWRESDTAGEADESAAEVARGAERGAEQPDFGREGS